MRMFFSLVGTLFTNGTTAFAASPQANIAFWNASVKNSGEVSELKPGYNHGKILYSILDGDGEADVERRPAMRLGIAAPYIYMGAVVS